MKNRIHNLLIMSSAVGVVHYHQIQQQNHLFHSVQPYISLVDGCKKALEHIFIERCNIYVFNINKLFQKIPVEIPKQPSQKEKCKSLLHAIVGGWYVKKLGHKLPPLKKSILSKKSQKKEDEIKIILTKANQY